MSESRSAIAILSLWVFLLVLAGSSSARAEEEVVAVKTYVSQDGVHAGETIDVAFVLDILPGWHINGPVAADQFLISCTLGIDENDAIEVVEIFFPDPETRSFSYSEVELQIYEGKVVLGARVKLGKTVPLGEAVVKASFLYQACDDRSCMPPETLEFAIPIQVVPTSKEIKPINEEIFSQIKFR